MLQGFFISDIQSSQLYQIIAQKKLPSIQRYLLSLNQQF
jgi:hypothetical protein